MTVKELIEVLETLPPDYKAEVSSGAIACVWICDEEQRIDIDYGNHYYECDGFDPSYRKAFDAAPGERIEG